MNGTSDPTRGPLSKRHDDIDLSEYGYALWQRRWVILATAFVCAVIALAVTMTRARGYEAQLALIVSEAKLDDREKQQHQVNAADYRPLLMSDAIAATVVRELHLDRAPYLLSTLPAGVVSVDDVRGANVLQLSVDFGDPKAAADIANAIARHAVEVTRRVSADEALQARDVIKQQLDEQQARLNDAEAKLAAYRNEAQIEALESDVDAMLARRRQSGSQVTAGRLDRAELPQLTLLHERQAKLRRLETERDIAEEIYRQVATRYDLARVQVASRSTQLQVLGWAVPPERPLPRGGLRNAILAGLFGFCMSVLIVLFAQAVRSATRRHAPPPACV